jgi:hypothetical protein
MLVVDLSLSLSLSLSLGDLYFICGAILDRVQRLVHLQLFTLAAPEMVTRTLPMPSKQNVSQEAYKWGDLLMILTLETALGESDH